MKDSYRGMIIYTQIANADFSKLNADLSTSDFSPFSGPLWAVGYGFTFKKNRRIFDLNVGAFGVGKKTERNDESIKTSFGSFFELAWGYDFIKSNRINFYPYLGVGLRSLSLDYKAKVQTNPSASDITNIIQNDRSVSDDVTELGMLVGLGFEVVLSKSNRPGGTILFIKAGTNRPFKQKSFDFDGYKYNSGLNPGNFIISTGFKFFSR
jgi:hypothetical protein